LVAIRAVRVQRARNRRWADRPEDEDGGTASAATFVPQVGRVPDAAPPFGPLDPVPCGSMGLGSVLATAFSPDGTL